MLGRESVLNYLRLAELRFSYWLRSRLELMRRSKV